MNAVGVAPSIMCADFLHLGRQLELFEEMGVDYLHVDIMDGHYVPNFTLGPAFCRQLAESCSIPLDIHLMIENVDAFVPEFARFPGAVVSFHPEASRHPLRTLDLIRAHGARAAIAVDPALPLESLRHLLPEVDQICLMTVNPGYAGQRLIPRALEKIRDLALLLAEKGLPVPIEVDGNVSWTHIPGMIERGARLLVAGTSSLFEPGADLRPNLQRLLGLAGRPPVGCP